MGIRDWLAIIVIVFIVLILLDGFRRKWLERKNRIRVKLDKNIPPPDGEDDGDVLIKSELPNGGARIKTRNGQEVPVLMDSVQLDDEDVAEYPADTVTAASDEDEEDWDDDWDDDADETDADVAEDLEDQEDAENAEHEEDEWDDDTVAGYPRSAAAAFSARDDDPVFADDGDDELADDDDDLDTSMPSDEEDTWLDEDYDDAGEASAASDDLEEPEDLEYDEDEEDLPEDPGEEPEPAPAPRKGRPVAADERIEPTFGDDVLTFGRDDQGELDLEHHDLFEHEHEDEDDADSSDDQAQAEEVIIINVMARPGTVIEGRRMLPILMKHGMRLGEMSIFHRHADNSGKGPVMFSMANMLRPGTFSISDMETFTTPGVSFFMQLPNKLGNMQCFDQMLQTAQAVKEALDANLKDENRSVFTRQTIEHSRQRIRDFELEMLARK